MGNRYKQVLLTYLRRAYASFGAPIWIALSIWAFITGDLGDSREYGFSSQFIGTLLAAGLLWAHFSDQMIPPQKQLIPDFFRWHVTVFLTLASAVTIGLPAISISRHGGGHIGVYTITIFLFGAVGLVSAMNYLSAIILPVACLPLVGAVFWQRVGNPSSPKGWLYTVLLLAIGVAETAIAVKLMARKSATSRPRIMEMPAGEAIDHGAELLRITGKNAHAGMKYPRQNHLAMKPKIGPWMLYRTFVRQWHHVQPRWLEIGFTAVVFLFAVIFYLSMRDSSPAHISFGAIAIFIALIALPGLIATGEWLQIVPCLVSESLKPICRRRFVIGIAAAMLTQIVTIWLIAAGMFILAMLCVGGGPAALRLVAPYGLASLLFQIITFVASWWSLPNRGIIWAALLPVLFFGLPFVLGPRTGYNDLLAIAAGSFLLGLLLIPIVYRRWMNLEMG
ncbi:MAG: hypothetical protein ACP5I8_15465 [Phycisphaerae bacterium]